MTENHNPRVHSGEHHDNRARCPECGSNDVQIESYITDDRGPVASCGFYCVSCGYLVPKTIVQEPKPEVGGYELKMRPNHSFGLVLRKDDIDERKAVLMTTTDGRIFCLRGWCSVREAKMHPEWLAADGGGKEVWVVPQSALLDLNILSGAN
jgi:hypothetical protein